MWVKRRFWRPAAVGFGLIVLLSLSAGLSVRLRSGLSELFSPFQEFLYPAFSAAGSAVSGIGRVIRAARLNLELERENEFLLREVLRLREMEEENRDLRGLLEFQRLSSFRTISSRVIGREVRHWRQSVLLDKGAADGVTSGAAVVTDRGVVGRVLETGLRTSRVLLLTDPNCRVGGMVQSSRTPGLAGGDSGGEIVLDYLSASGEVVPGELVVTSGMSLFFPPGIPIGRIRETRLEKLGLYRSAVLDPLVDFDRLTLVMILLREGPGGKS